MKYFFAAMVIAGLVLAFNVAGLVETGSRIPQPQAVGSQLAEKDIPPTAIRVRYFNPDGSCVQCAFGMHGVKCNDDNAAHLLVKSEYGPAVRGGSNPSRVAAYCNARGIDAFVVTGEATWQYMKWAATTGRGAAIAAGWRHFQFVADYNPESGVWYVCDNQHPKVIDGYSESEFARLHKAGGQWGVFLKCHAPPPLAVTEIRAVRCDSPFLWLSFLFT